MPSVLFVCTANQFRSPLAAVYFSQELSLHGYFEEWMVESAGTWAQPGFPAVSQAQQAALQFGLSLKGHLSRQVTLDLLDHFDLVLAMEAGQVEAMRTEFRSMAYKIHLLTEIASGTSYNIPDPFLTEVKPSEISTELHDLIKGGFEQILALANELRENPPKSKI